MNPAEFAWQAGLAAPVAVETLDQALLAAAIFHESNRVRIEAGLPGLQALQKLNAAAEIESRVGGAFSPPSHNNIFAAIGTPLERVKAAGLRPRYVAENIALVPIYVLGPGAALGVIRREGRTEFVDPASGRELPPHTYATYAAAVVRSWMNSPGHRKNLLDPAVKFLGCSVLPKRGRYGEETVFSVEVFYLPQ